jgi:hypothetical protein
MCELHQTDVSPKEVTNSALSTGFNNTIYEKSEDNEELKDLSLYRSLVMSMQYGTLVMPSVKYHIIRLATRQSCPKVGDYKKALKVLEYMHYKRKKPVYIYGYGANPNIYVYADAAFDVYANSVSHSGLCIFIGDAGGAMHCSSNKQKCVTDSSTAAEIVAAVGGLYIAQYYKDILAIFNIRCNVIHYEDNMSCISLAKTGCTSFDKKDKHIIRKINLMKRHFDDESMRASLEWCDTAWMIADSLTKDMHGAGFDINENILMGHPIGDIGDYGTKKNKPKVSV